MTSPSPARSSARPLPRGVCAGATVRTRSATPSRRRGAGPRRSSTRAGGARRVTQRRETYDRGDGAVVLPYDTGRGCVLLTRQFRYPAYVNDHPDGMLVEAAAGLLDSEDPSTAVRREAAEELGVTLGPLTRVLDAYLSPGSVTERLHGAPDVRAPAQFVVSGCRR
ncbi:NUDIX domain-containing protein [Streptomyces sp. ms191]|nr:NUDIX domain-containing protein [Streptomyces sp. ms191]